jgi:Mg2+ and Co2+ transporter CorA
LQASNLNAQNDSKIATQIAELSRTDGRVMKTISILGLVFLPGTFVSVSMFLFKHFLFLSF